MGPHDIHPSLSFCELPLRGFLFCRGGMVEGKELWWDAKKWQGD